MTMTVKKILVALAVFGAVSIAVAGAWTLTGQLAIAGCSSGC
jgi:hypothetical protein